MPHRRRKPCTMQRGEMALAQTGLGSLSIPLQRDESMREGGELWVQHRGKKRYGPGLFGLGPAPVLKSGLERRG